MPTQSLTTPLSGIIFVEVGGGHYLASYDSPTRMTITIKNPHVIYTLGKNRLLNIYYIIFTLQSTIYVMYNINIFLHKQIILIL